MDDIVLGGKSKAEMNAAKTKLSQKFEMKDLGPLHHFLEPSSIHNLFFKCINFNKQMNKQTKRQANKQTNKQTKKGQWERAHNTYMKGERKCEKHKFNV